MNPKQISASSVVRVAGNIASGMVGGCIPDEAHMTQIAEASLKLAYMIVHAVEAEETKQPAAERTAWVPLPPRKPDHAK